MKSSATPLGSAKGSATRGGSHRDRSRAGRASWILVAAGLLLVGCARSAEERQLQAMQEEIDRTHDPAEGRTGPSDRPESHWGVPSDYGPGASSSPAVRPPPPVVQLGGEGASESDETADPQDSTPRPSIRVQGGVRVGRGGPRTDDTIEESGPDDASSASAPGPRDPSIDPEAKRAYDGAIALVNAKRYDEALEAFARFLVKWPDHPYANNAMFWRGECYFARGDYGHAVQQYEGVLARFPGAAKVPDALLKLGLSQQKLGNEMKAKQAFDQLARQYPDSDAAHRLQALQSGGGERR